jgi:hypothetical protein
MPLLFALVAYRLFGTISLVMAIVKAAEASTILVRARAMTFTDEDAALTTYLFPALLLVPMLRIRPAPNLTLRSPSLTLVPTSLIHLW